MPTRRKSKTPAPQPERLGVLAVPGNGEKMRWLKPGMTIKVTGARGEFRIKYIALDGTLDCWGGTQGKLRMRSFRPDRFKSVVRKPIDRSQTVES